MARIASCHPSTVSAPCSTLMMEPMWRRTIPSRSFATSRRTLSRCGVPGAVNAARVSCVICPTFSSSVIRASSESARARMAAVCACSRPAPAASAMASTAVRPEIRLMSSAGDWMFGRATCTPRTILNSSLTQSRGDTENSAPR